MKTFLLRTKALHCDQCGMAMLLIMSAEDEEEARNMASLSNSHGKAVTGVDWLNTDATLCEEVPRDRPRGIVAGAYFYDPKPAN